MPAGKNKIRLIGRREYADFPELNLYGVEAKIDTGAYTSAIHCSDIEVRTVNQMPVLYFRLPDNTSPGSAGPIHEFHNFFRKKIKNSFGEMEERYIIKTLVKIGRKKIRTTLSLSDRENMRYPVLIGRRLLKKKFIVDVDRIHTGGEKIRNVINDYI